MKFENALITMKAFPFHRGHEFLINEALRQSEHVTVIVVWGEGQNPSGELRQKWIQQTFPQVDVRLAVDLYTDESDVKAESSGDMVTLLNNSRMWAVYADDIVGGQKIDAVFSSESYGERWASYLGAEHVLVDLHRTYLPISGTMIREDPYLYWPYLNKFARQHYLKRVLVVGAESSGKTTLCRNLSLKYGTVYSPEYGRIYDEQTRGPKEEFDEARYRIIYAEIANKQPQLDRRAEEDARHVCFFDTDLNTTAMWYKNWQSEFGEDGLYRSILEAANKQPKYDLVLLQGLAPWVDDGYRGQDEDTRERFYKELVDKHWMKNLVFLSGSWEEREKFAIQEVNRLFEGSKVTLP